MEIIFLIYFNPNSSESESLFAFSIKSSTNLSNRDSQCLVIKYDPSPNPTAEPIKEKVIVAAVNANLQKSLIN